MAERRRRKGFNLEKLWDGGGSLLGETAQDKGEQDGREVENGRRRLEDHRFPREEEGSVLQTVETQGRRHIECGPGKLEELVQRLESGNMGDRRNNWGSFKPLKPRMYSGERNSVILTRWIRETEPVLVQSQVEPDLWVMVSTSFLDGSAQH